MVYGLFTLDSNSLITYNQYFNNQLSHHELEQVH